MSWVKAGALAVIDDAKAKTHFSPNDTFKFLTSEQYLDQLHNLPWEGLHWDKKSCWLTKTPCTCKYKYNGRKKEGWKPTPFPPWLLKLTSDIEAFLDLPEWSLVGCNANKYSANSQHLNWHSDDEPMFRKSEIDRDTLIVSLSFGVSKGFAFRKKFASEETPITLKHGDILVMTGLTQDEYQHCVHATSSDTASSSSSTTSPVTRFNITWRLIRKHEPHCEMSN